jgi:hypothetical protein
VQPAQDPADLGVGGPYRQLAVARGLVVGRGSRCTCTEARASPGTPPVRAATRCTSSPRSTSWVRIAWTWTDGPLLPKTGTPGSVHT